MKKGDHQYFDWGEMYWRGHKSNLMLVFIAINANIATVRRLTTCTVEAARDEYDSGL